MIFPLGYGGCNGGGHGESNLNIDMIAGHLFAGPGPVYRPFGRLLIVRMLFLLRVLRVFVNLCMANGIGFIYFFSNLALFLAELACEILLLHLGMPLLELLNPVDDLRLKNLSLDGADHVDPFA